MCGGQGVLAMILVIDDHDSTRRLLLLMLQSDGYEAVAVRSAAEALALMADTTPELVILDFHMPAMNGMSVFEQMRKSESLSGVPVIFFSADDDEEIRQAALKAGAQVWIVKGSMDWAVLQREIVRLIGPGSGQHDWPDTGGAKRGRDCG